VREVPREGVRLGDVLLAETDAVRELAGVWEGARELLGVEEGARELLGVVGVGELLGVEEEVGETLTSGSATTM